MSSSLPSRTLVVSSLAIVGITLGCHGSPPLGPTPAPTPALTVGAISPNTGSTAGGAVLTIVGTGFESGAIVTLDNIATIATVVSSTNITATAPAHSAGLVNVVVTNPGGQTARLTAGFTYAEPPQPSVVAVSPTIGSTGGGTPLKITGPGFQYNVTVTIDGVVTKATLFNGSIYLTTLPHAAGSVDIVVSNPGGRTDPVAGGYTYAPPESFDFNGTWEGGDHETPIRFTIQNNALTTVACGTSATFTVSPPTPVSNGEFSFSRDDGLVVSGAIAAASYAHGTVNIPGIAFCTNSPWRADKR